MNLSLGSVLEQIKQYEKFVELCDQVRNLERQQELQLPERRQNVELEKASLMAELSSVCANQASWEAILSGEETAVEEFNEDEARDYIKTADLQKHLLRTSINKLNKQLEAIEESVENNAVKLEPLYQAMDKYLQVGFDPDTAHSTLAALVVERDRLRRAIKRQMSGK